MAGGSNEERVFARRVFEPPANGTLVLQCNGHTKQVKDFSTVSPHYQKAGALSQQPIHALLVLNTES